MKKNINLILSITFFLTILASIIFFIIFISKIYLDKKFNTLFFSLLCSMIILLVVIYSMIKLTLNEFERNHKNYIAKRFSFLLDKGYKMSHRFINGESVSSFYNDIISFDLFIEFEYMDIVIRRGLKFPYEKEANNGEILKDVDYEHNLKLLSPIHKIDLFTELIKDNYDEIITYIEE